MKVIYLCFLLSLFGSCIELKRVATSKEFIVYGFDFTKYANQGFLFTPLEIVDRPYEGRGLVRIEGWPKVHLLTTLVPAPNGSGLVEQKKFTPEKMDPSELINEAYEYAKSIGADAIIQFKITSKTGNRGNINVDGLELYGFAIKRL